jgi:nucleoside-diphosphate-sugar epimerase
MRVLVTGGGGFIGGEVCRQLVARGDEVVAIVRDPARSGRLAALGATIIAGDLGSSDGIRAALGSADAAIHLAGSYRIGIPAFEHPQMWDANVGTTDRFLDAVAAAGTPRSVYVSTANVFGNTRGTIVDEAYRRNAADGFVSWYDRTKYEAHLRAQRRISAGLPLAIAMPGAVYGPGDHSQAGDQLRRAYHGTLPTVALADAGLSLNHVENVAAGIVAALDRGSLGESYVLAGHAVRLGDAIALAARLGGHKPPRLAVPTALLRALAPVGALAGPILGTPPDLAEVISSADDVTYWASSAKAVRELGYAIRDLEDGLRASLAAS